MRASDADAMERRLRELPTREPFRFPSDAIPSFFRRAAVLIAFWRDGDDLFVALTERARHLRTHGGMVSFPGGQLDPGEDWADAAIREAYEEVGLDPTSVEVLGQLDDAWSSAKHHLVPVVGWLGGVPDFVANPDEVARIMLTPVSEVLRPNERRDETVYLGTVPCVNTTIEVSLGRVFGLTADLLLEAVEWASGEEPQRGRVRLRELEAANAVRWHDEDG
ncbi:MAG: CoA pyrophosphatase [bacterium]|nr:CoA pyrophosphatase [bacterium]